MPTPDPTTLTTIGNPLMWAGFVVFMLAAMALDLSLGKRNKAMSTRSALIWCAVWVSLALVFNGWIYHEFGSDAAQKFFAGYLLEKSLSVDNLFVFVLIFAYFRTPLHLQHRALVWGIIGAMVLRAVMILAGAALIAKFHWTLVIFGGFLVFTGIKLLFADEDNDISKSRLVRILRAHLPLTDGYRGDAFIVFEPDPVPDGAPVGPPKRRFTYLFLTVLVIEFSDVIFAVDSVPAIFGVTTDPFIVFTSNMFAILGLRALFFAIAGAIQKLRYLNYGLAIVLSFIGVKMILGYAHDVLVAEELVTIAGVIPVEWLKIDIDTSLAVICGVLALTAGLSVLAARRDTNEPSEPSPKVPATDRAEQTQPQETAEEPASTQEETP